MLWKDMGVFTSVGDTLRFHGLHYFFNIAHFLPLLLVTWPSLRDKFKTLTEELKHQRLLQRPCKDSHLKKDHANKWTILCLIIYAFRRRFGNALCSMALYIKWKIKQQDIMYDVTLAPSSSRDGHCAQNNIWCVRKRSSPGEPRGWWQWIIVNKVTWLSKSCAYAHTRTLTRSLKAFC